jgi:diguanylate cyclase (GGDEF)-like protein/putative nucleotidyltransferase with HDIG domain
MATSTLVNPQFYRRLARRVLSAVDQFATDWVIQEKTQSVGKLWKKSSERSAPVLPEEDIRQLVKYAASLEDIWDFFKRRLNHDAKVDLMCFSILDESQDFARVRFYECAAAMSDAQDSVMPGSSVGTSGCRFGESGPMVSLSDKANHLIQAFIRKDTTFTNKTADLGTELLNRLQMDSESQPHLHIFSVPLIAANKTIALMTLGFSEIDAFSQAKLSYMYTVRDQIAQLVWNLILLERMATQTQMDSLTGLLSYTSCHRVLTKELAYAKENQTPLTLMILDINHLAEINQTLGHHYGDEAICHLASTVRRHIRGVDTVGRYGADEIMVILPEVDPAMASGMAEAFMEGLANRAHRRSEALKDLSISIGYATYPHDQRQQEQLLQRAEQALELAKYQGEKQGGSSQVGCQQVNALSEKTVLEVFASQIAKKYNNTNNPTLFQELMAQIESREDWAKTPESLMLETISSLAGALDAKDKYTQGHSQAVANYAVALAHALELPKEEVENVRLAGFLHDIGKIGIPESILCKSAPLNEKEWELMKQHPVIGARQILAPVTALKDVIPMVEFHHENWDGSGYPMGLKGEEIPLGARIVAIVDAFHGLTSDRSYRKALPVAEAKAILEETSGIKWDPQLLQVFFGLLTQATPVKA